MNDKMRKQQVKGFLTLFIVMFMFVAGLGSGRAIKETVYMSKNGRDTYSYSSEFSQGDFVKVEVELSSPMGVVVNMVGEDSYLKQYKEESVEKDSFIFNIPKNGIYQFIILIPSFPNIELITMTVSINKEFYSVITIVISAVVLVGLGAFVVRNKMKSKNSK